jgi:hypothetical protein
MTASWRFFHGRPKRKIADQFSTSKSASSEKVEKSG